MQRSLGLVVGLAFLCMPILAMQGELPKATTDRPIWVASWKTVWADLPHVTPMLWLDGALLCNPNPGDRLPDPVRVAEASKTLPVGRRVLLWYRYFTTFWTCTEDEVRSEATGATYPGPWADAAMARIEMEWSRWLDQFQQAGGRLDVLVGDCEDWSKFTNWWLKSDQLAAIRADARFRRAKYGLEPLADLLKGVNLDKVIDNASSNEYLAWNLAISKLTAAEMTRAVWDPACKAFPALKGSNYGGVRSITQPAPDPNGHPQPLDCVVGTSPSPVAYGSLLQASTSCSIDQADPTRLVLGGRQRLPQDAWSSFLIDQQQGRAARRGSPDRPLMPWIASPTFVGDDGHSIGYPKDPRYYIENVLHYALLGTEIFLWWNPLVGGEQPLPADLKLAQFLEGIMVRLNEQTGGVVERTIEASPVRFDAPFVLTGARCRDGRTLWRVTFKPDVRSYRRIETGELRTLPSNAVGEWIQTADDRPPAITVDAGP